MAFDSLGYAAFLGVATTAYFLSPQSFRWLVLLAASYSFYLAGDGTIAALILSTLATYSIAHRLGAKTRSGSGGPLLQLGVIVNVALIVVFKYLTPQLGWAVPLGISFFTLQAMGYLVDVARDDRPPENRLSHFAAYMAFFPHVAAGPIGRSANLLPQFDQNHPLEAARVAGGLRLIVWGFFQKLVIADNLGMFADSVYGDVRAYSGAPLLMATLFFAVQLYSNFAGYSNIALGSAQLLGFALAPNFDRPYFASNLADFWRRWHMSLSGWLSHYIHQPLSVRLRGRGRLGLIASILTTFILCGLWHGAAWTYLAWGLLHGLGLSAIALTRHPRQYLARRVPSALWPVLSVMATFTFVCCGWVIFRADNLEDAWYVIAHLAPIDPHSLIGVPTVSRATVIKDAVLWSFAFVSDLAAPWVQRALAGSRWPATYWTCVLLGLGIYVLGVFERQTFIYTAF